MRVFEEKFLEGGGPFFETNPFPVSLSFAINGKRDLYPFERGRKEARRKDERAGGEGSSYDNGGHR